MKVYRGMDIGTAKPTVRDRERVRHYMIDIVEPSEPFSMARYLTGATEAETSIVGRGGLPMFVGGTALYVRGLLYGIFEGPSADRSVRRDLDAKARLQGVPALHRDLQSLDPVAATRIHPNDEKRLVRALEVIRLTGRRLSELQTQHGRPGAMRPAKVVVLRRDPEDLRRRIGRRVREMFEQGLVEEVQRLRPSWGRTASAAVGYREVADYLDGRLTLDQAIEEVCRRTWRLARKQMTWFRSFETAEWIDVGTTHSTKDVVDRVMALWEGTLN
jgi:tRNA dimethylallyltransferase